MLANSFASVNVRGKTCVTLLDTSRGFTDGEWLLVCTIADGLEWSTVENRLPRSGCASRFTLRTRLDCTRANWLVPRSATSTPSVDARARQSEVARQGGVTGAGTHGA